jgi:LPS O-antigen subunit length determinant protein (WzzB/FepE family)
MQKPGVLVASLAVVLTAVLLGCSSTETDWQQAASANTIGSYQNFLKAHPNGQHADEARNRIHGLEDDQAWMTAMNTNTEQSYQHYLGTEPNGAHAQDARDHITGLQRAAAWQTAQAQGTPAALQAFLQKYPQGAEADQARAQLDKLNDQYRVQLAAFRSKKAAERDSTRLKTRLRKVMHDVVVVPPTPPDKLTRVTSDLMSQSGAASLCAKLRRAHQPCKVVKMGAERLARG